MTTSPRTVSWRGVFRLGLVQAAIGAIAVLVTSTLNRIMVVEYALPALLPALLVALHYGVQLARPKFGHDTDAGGGAERRIRVGMSLLACGALVATAGVALVPARELTALLIAAAGYALVGFGVGMAGTNVLTVLACTVPAEERAPAATALWFCMIVGFALAAVGAAHLLDPYGPLRLLYTAATICALSLLATFAALAGQRSAARGAEPATDAAAFRRTLGLVWREPTTRRFTVFVFLSMLAYSAEELLIEPCAGLVFGYTPGRSSALSGSLHGGAALGMLALVVLAKLRRQRTLSRWVVGGCIASGLSLALLAVVATGGVASAVSGSVGLLGFANGLYTAAALGAMLEFAADGRDGREGIRMGLFGAAQAVAFAVGGLSGAGLADLLRHAGAAPGTAYGTVFAGEAVIFAAAALWVRGRSTATAHVSPPPHLRPVTWPSAGS